MTFSFSDHRFALAAFLIEKRRLCFLSLDVFEGLLGRRAPKRSDVLLSLGCALHQTGKLGLGQTPESFALWRHRLAQKESWPSLEKIYEEMPPGLLTEKPSFYVRQELLVEDALSFINDDALKLVAFAAQKKLKIFLLSDVALSAKRLLAFLKEKAPRFPDPALVLTASQTTANDKKALLEKAARSFGFALSQGLHIGPSLFSLSSQETASGLHLLDPAADAIDFAATMDEELPATWSERRAFFAASSGDAGLSWLRRRAAFTLPETIALKDRAFYLYGMQVLGPILVPFAIEVASRLAAQKIKTLFAPSDDARFLAALVTLFAPKLSIKTAAPSGQSAWLELDDFHAPTNVPLVFPLFSTRASLDLQKQGIIVQGFLTQNQNPCDLHEAWASASRRIKSFCATPSPLGAQAVRATQQGVKAFATQFLELNKKESLPSLLLWAQATARRVLSRPTDAETLWLDALSSTDDSHDPSFKKALPPPEESRLRQRADNALKKAVKTKVLDYDLWRALLLQPTLLQRRFLSRYLASRVQEIGRSDLLNGLYRQLWTLGERDYAMFRKLWPLFRSEPPTLEAWNFIREAVLAAEERQDVTYLLDAQNQSHALSNRSYRLRLPLVSYQDPVLTRALERVLSPLRPTLAPLEPLKGRPLRLCFVISGDAAGPYNPVSDVLFNMAEELHALGAEISFASIDHKDHMGSSPELLTWLKKLAPKAKSFFYRDPFLSLGESFLRLARQIADGRFDALIFPSVTNTRLALAALRPAPLLVGLGFGWPENYSSPFLDFVAQWTDYPFFSCLCDSYRVPDSMPKQRFRAPPKPLSRKALSIPKGVPLVVSSGRPIKYYEPLYWQIVTSILERRPQTHFIFVGPTYESMREWLDPHLPQKYLPNLRFLGYRRDHAEVLSCADIVLDTIPVGGGFNLTEAMNLGLPTVLCRNKTEDLFAPYDNRFMLPTGEILKEPSLNFTRNDKDGVCAAVVRLIDNPKERKRLSRLMKQTAALRKKPRKSAEGIEALIRARLAALRISSV